MRKFLVRRLTSACSIFIGLLSIGLLSGVAHAQVSVTTYHNDNSRTGANTQETILTPANVNSHSFGKLFSVPLDGEVYAQPLYLTGVTIGGGSHNVAYLATENDSVYAIDADSGTIYAQTSLIPPGGSTISSTSDLNCGDLIPQIGITGTPVIDPNTKTLYVVANAKTAGGTVVQYLHALDVATLAEKFGGPTLITASVPGTAPDASNGSVAFNPLSEFQRPALLLENGHVVIGWGGHCDAYPWHGWVMSYSASTLAQEAVFNVSPNGSGGAVWMSGGGLAADASGNIYFATGNGDWNGSTEFGDSIVKLGPPSGGKFTVVDYFTPWNQEALFTGDLDVSGGGLVLLPAISSGEQLIVQQGKFGTLVLLNSANLGKYCGNDTPACTSSDPNAVQEITAAGGGFWGSPAYWNGNVYIVPAGSGVRAWSFNAGNSGLLSTTPTSQSSQTFAYAPPTPEVSANGSTNGIVWVVSGPGYKSVCNSNNCLGLFAYDATNMSNLLYSSSQSGTDGPGVTVKYGVPVVANGKVYIGTQAGLVVYGLLSNAAMVAAPSFSEPAGSYTGTQSLSLSDSTPGASIYYTLDGTTPSTSSAKYSGPLTLSASTTVQAIAAASGYTNSAVASATYVITASSGGGGGGSTVSVSLSGSDNLYGITTNGTAVPNGGLDGSGYTYSANLLGSTLAWNGSTFTFGAANTADAASSKTVALPAGNYTTLNLLGAGSNGNQPNQTFTVSYSDGTKSTFTQSVSDWLSPQGYTGESIVSTMGYRLSITGASSPGPVYLYGYSFALNSAKTVSSLTLPNNIDVAVLAIDLTPAPTATPTAATPTLSPAAGSYSGSTVTVSLSDTTPGATIYYTLDGTTPTTTGAAVYNVPISLSESTTVRTIAAASGYNNSAAASATYVVNAASGGSSSTVSVSLSSVDNVYGITTNGTAVPNGALDGSGYTYSANLLGSSLAWNGSTFTFGAANTADAVNSKTIALPAGNYSKLALLGSGFSGNQLNQTFTVTYSDGTTSTFTQSLSDWFNPQGYAGESIVSTMGYRVSITGATSPQTVYLYGYSFALNGAKTVSSLTLPNNSYVSVLAVDLTPAPKVTPTAATPTFSPAAGSYSSSTVTVSLADATAGATIYYTLDGSTPSTSSAKYSAALTLSASTTVQAIAVASGYNNSAVGSATYTISSGSGGGSGTTVSVSLSASDTLYGITTNGTAVPNGGLDGSGYTYSANLLGSSLAWNGSTFTFGAANTANAASSKTIALPAGNYSTLNLLASGFSGNQPNQTFTVTYSDGTTSTFTQSLSDWFNPQGYTGETIVSTMGYRVSITGATSPGPVYLYGYSFALNSTKSVSSLTLPNNVDVAVLAVDLTPAPKVTPTAATPTFSPAAGSYSSSTVTVSLADATAGATIYYTLDGSTPSTSSAKYSAALTLSASTTVQAIAVASGYNNSAVGSATYTISSSGGSSGGGGSGTTVSVSLSGADNLYGITTNGTAVPNSGLDGSGYTYSANLLGSSLAWNGSTFTFGAANSADAASSKTIALPAGNYTTLNLLGTGVNGNQTNQTFTVTYSDGTTSTFTQSLSDWFNPQGYTGESIVSTMGYRVSITGATSPGPVYLYGYSFALNSAKAVSSLTLPNNINVIVLAIDLTASNQAATPTFSPTPGSYAGSVSVTLADSTPGASIYYTTNGTTPTTSSTRYSASLTLTATTTIQAIAVASGYSSSAVASATYAMTAASPTFSPTPGSFSTSTVQVSLADATPGAVIYYTLNGTTPTSGSSKYTGPLTLSASTTIQAIAIAAGYNNSTVSSATYSLGTATPTFSPAAGTYSTSTVSVSLADSTPGASIYYTTNGTTPSTSSTKYTSALTLSANTTIQAIAVASGYTNSAVASATYGVTAPSPTFSVAAGNYTSTQTVSLSDTIPGASIYYTTNGSTPTTGSTKYSTPISVSATTTIQAIAVASGYTNSAVASATYTISAPAPVSVSLGSAANVYAIVNIGSKVSGTGVDRHEYAYPAQQLGTQVSWAGSTFTFGTPGTLNGMESTTLTLPSGNYSALNMLGTAVNGDKLNMPFVVTYSDGTTTTFYQSMSDWCYPTSSSYAGQTIVVTTSDRVEPSGAVQVASCHVYGYSFALNSAKKAVSLTLPPSYVNAVAVLAVDVVPP